MAKIIKLKLHNPYPSWVDEDEVINGLLMVDKVKYSIIFSINHFDIINVAYGAGEGERLCAEVRGRIMSSLIDVFNENIVDEMDVKACDGRISLEIFIDKGENLERLIARIIDGVEGYPFYVSGSSVSVSLSAGVAKSNNIRRDLGDWAKIALVDAAQAGGARLKVVDPDETGFDGFVSDMNIVGDIQLAMDDGCVFLAYQAVYHADSDEVDYYECLLRVLDGEKGVSSAEPYVLALERLGLIGRLDRYVLGQVLDELSESPNISLGCNISGKSVGDILWVTECVSMLKDRPELLSRLVIEITETAEIRDFNVVSQFIKQLRLLGCRIALDDFGVGFASIAYLQKLEFDIVKIDKAFLSSSDDVMFPTFARNEIIGHLAGLASKLGSQVVVEGVESAEHLQSICFETVTHVQGYFFGIPSFSRPWKEVAGE